MNQNLSRVWNVTVPSVHRCHPALVKSNTSSVTRIGATLFLLLLGFFGRVEAQTVDYFKPSIRSFTASPATINSGSVATLNWSVRSARSLTIDNGVGTVAGTSVSVRPAQTTTYTLTATNSRGAVTART